MKIAIRADASNEIGTGHIMRCIALADWLSERGAMVTFLCAMLPVPLKNLLHARGYDTQEIVASAGSPEDAAACIRALRDIKTPDLLVVDHYGIDASWESAMRPHVSRIMVIDDLANRSHDCDVLLDQNLHDDSAGKYLDLVPRGALKFLGPKYALLRHEFDDPALVRERSGTVERLFVFFGGTDPGCQSVTVLRALRQLRVPAPKCTLVLGPANPFLKDAIAHSADLPFVEVIESTTRISRLMADADLAIGTCGVAAWERCALGLPALVVITADNQREDARLLAKLGAVESLGDAQDVDATAWASALEGLLSDPPRLEAMSRAALQIMSGRRDARDEMIGALLNAQS